MHTWAPIFSKIVDSSLWAEPDHVVKVFLTMMAKQDPDHVVRASAYQIGEWSKKGEAVALDALRILSSPDTKRLEPQPYEGRRIERVQDGWLLLNGQLYEDLMREMNRKVYKARKERERRERQKSNKNNGKPLPGEATFNKAEIAGASEKQLHRIMNEPAEVIDEEKRKKAAEEFKKGGYKYPPSGSEYEGQIVVERPKTPWFTGRPGE